MLVLSRKKDECIVINNDITIVVVEIRGDKVRLGVEAPKEVPVHRKEVYEAIVRDDGGAAALSAVEGPSAAIEVSEGAVSGQPGGDDGPSLPPSSSSGSAQSSPPAI
jgi:carbon storage regulator